MGNGRLRLGICAAVPLLGLLATSCSGSDDPAGSPSETTPHTRPSVVEPVTTPRPHRDPYPALCRRLAVPDVQKLFRRQLGPMTTGGGSDCQFAPRGSLSDVNTLKVYLRLKDGDKTLFNHIGDIDYGTFTPLTGLGYQAKWAYRGFVPITVVDVRKGSFTCTVIPPPNEGVTALAHPGAETDQPVAKPVATAFARDLGTLCRDIFATH